jgi:hypothetical protein
LTNKKLHIIALDVPFPADYGGAIDMFYRIKALHELGVELILHVFEYGRGQQAELEKYGTVHYYKRSRSILHLFSKRPFIVQSRLSEELIDNLLKDDAPILMEGLHTSGILEHHELSKRVTMVRMHNIEHEYYRELAKNASFLKGLFFLIEAHKLKRYTPILKQANAILAIKESDREYFEKINPSCFLLPACFEFPSFEKLITQPYALFHGNLSVPENESAAIWLVKALEQELSVSFPLIVAGKNPGSKLMQLEKKEIIKLVANPSDSELKELQVNAHIHVFYSEAPSGMKLKLMNVLATNGHILCNENMLGYDGLEAFCIIENESENFARRFVELKEKPLSSAEYENRKSFMSTHFNTKSQCEIIIKLINEA